MATMTLTDCANSAGRFLGIIDSGGSLSNQQLLDAQEAINNLIDNWSSDRLMALSALVADFAVTGATSYAIGTGAAWNTPRPSAIEAATYLLSANGGVLALPLRVLNANDFSSLPDRRSTSVVAKALFYDRGNPTGNVYLAPVPLNGGSVELVMWSAMTQFPDLVTAITVSPGYSRMLQLAAAVEMAPQYDVTPTPALIENYTDALARVRQLNAEILGPEPPAGISSPDQNPGPVSSPSGAPGG